MSIDPVTGLNSKGNRRGTPKGSRQALKDHRRPAPKGHSRSLKHGAGSRQPEKLVSATGITFADTAEAVRDALEGAGATDPAYRTTAETYLRVFHKFRVLDDAPELTVDAEKVRARCVDQMTELAERMGMTPSSQSKFQFRERIAAKEAQKPQPASRTDPAARIEMVKRLISMGQMPGVYLLSDIATLIQNDAIPGAVWIGTSDVPEAEVVEDDPLADIPARPLPAVRSINTNHH